MKTKTLFGYSLVSDTGAIHAQSRDALVQHIRNHNAEFGQTWRGKICVDIKKDQQIPVAFFSLGLIESV